MPCYKRTSVPSGGTVVGGAYRTEAECLQACKEGACCEGTTCSVKPQCQCQGTGKVFQGAGTVCTPNPCDTSCKPCDGRTVPSKATVTAVVDDIILTTDPNTPFTLDQLNGWLAGTYVLNKTDIGNPDIVYYQFGGWPVQTGSRYADMIYVCSRAGDSGLVPGPTCTVSYNQHGFEAKVFCYSNRSTQQGNICNGIAEIAFGDILTTGRLFAGTARMTVS
jgi:hypothetical protein